MKASLPKCFFLAFIAVIAASCSSGNKPGSNFDSVKTKLLHPRPLKAGRYQLPTTHTPAPDFWITIPTGYQLKYVGKMPDDEFYVFRTDDPSMSDSAALTSGVLRVYVGTMPQLGLKGDTIDYMRDAKICGQKVSWRGATEYVNGQKFYIREIASPTFFAALDTSLRTAPLNLHLYAAGTDTLKVNELMIAAETLDRIP